MTCDLYLLEQVRGTQALGSFLNLSGDGVIKHNFSPLCPFPNLYGLSFGWMTALDRTPAPPLLDPEFVKFPWERITSLTCWGSSWQGVV